jgi:DNA-binding NarL/FixJ family response regulator
MAQKAVVIETVPLCQLALTDVLKNAGISKVEYRTAVVTDGPLRASDADLVVASLEVVDLSLRAALNRLRSEFHEAPLVITSEHVERKKVFELLAMGIDGFIPKTLPIKAMTEAYCAVLDGHTYVPIFDHETAQNSNAPLLTERQYEIMALLQRGLTNKEIARELMISPGTVKVHLNTVYRSIGVHNRVAAIAALNGDASGVPNHSGSNVHPRFSAPKQHNLKTDDGLFLLQKA